MDLVSDSISVDLLNALAVRTKLRSFQKTCTVLPQWYRSKDETTASLVLYKTKRKSFSLLYMKTVFRRCLICTTYYRNHLLHVVHMSHTKWNPLLLAATPHSGQIALSMCHVCLYNFPAFIPVSFAIISYWTPAIEAHNYTHGLA